MKNFFLLKIINKFFLSIEKRTRFFISTLVMTGLMLLSTFFLFDISWLFVLIFIITTYFFTYFSVLEGVEKIEWFMLFLIPILLTIAFYLFYFLFPIRWLTRAPFIIFYGISIYAILLTSNIFNVGAEKNLQLYRAAFSVNYFFQTLIIFLMSNLVLSLRLNFYLNGIIFFLITGIVASHLIWSIKLKHAFDQEVVRYSLIIGLVIGEIAIILSFIPLKATIFSLIITSIYYSLTGLTYAYIDQRLFKETIREYLIVLIFVLIISVLTITW